MLKWEVNFVAQVYKREREMERGNFTCTFIVGQPKEIISISISGNLKDQDYYIFVRY